MDDRLDEAWVYRVGGASAVAGALIGLAGNLIHPVTPGPGDPEGTARVVAESATWIPVHIALIIGFVLMLGGLIAIERSLVGGLPRALARFGLAAGTVGTTVGVVVLTVDGFTAPHLAEGWLAAPPEMRAHALASFRASEGVNFALLSPLNLVFSGFTFVLFGLATATSEQYPRWAGWVVALGGAAGAVSGVIQAQMGEPTPVSSSIGIAGPTVITLWLLGMGVLLLRREAGYPHHGGRRGRQRPGRRVVTPVAGSLLVRPPPPDDAEVALRWLDVPRRPWL